jgi:hypothetical protein
MTKTILDKLNDLLCKFPIDEYSELNELPKWLQQDYHDLEDLCEDVLVRPGQSITKKELRWANGVNKSVNKLLNFEKKT